MAKRTGAWVEFALALTACALAAGAIGCASTKGDSGDATAAADAVSASGPPELASYMDPVHRYSQKLGFAIGGRNDAVAAFYLAELAVQMDRISEEFPTYEGRPIAAPLQRIILPAIARLEIRLRQKDWDAADRDYGKLIDACNACHASAGYSFIQILPAGGESPFNQRF